MDTLHELFPIPVLETHLPVSLTALQYCKSLEYTRHDNYSVSNSHKVLDHFSLSRVKEFILRKLQTYFYDMCGFSRDVSPEIVTSWVNWHTEGDWAQEHAHSNSTLSFCWYVSVAKDSGNFVLMSSTQMFGNQSYRYQEYNNFNSPSYEVFPRDGSLIIFPSTLRHSVPRHNVEGFDRISLAGNVMMRGIVNSEFAEVHV